MGLDSVPIDFQTYYFFHVLVVPPTGYGLVMMTMAMMMTVMTMAMTTMVTMMTTMMMVTMTGCAAADADDDDEL